LFIGPFVQDMTILSILSEMNCFANWPEEGYDGLLGYWVIGLLGYWVIGLLGYGCLGVKLKTILFSVTSFPQCLGIFKEKV
jgi:hypothetical protein